MANIIVAPLGENITKAVVSYWFFKAGDKVKANEDLVELVTDKATFNVPSPCAGELTQIMAQEGSTVNVGDVLGVIRE